MTFYNTLKLYDWDEITSSINAKGLNDVRQALSSNSPTLEDFKALVSPAADALLEEMARESYKITRQRFGKVIQLYIPLYLSNFCANGCLYCGFKADNKIKRKLLTPEEIEEEITLLKKYPFKHVLLVTGEASQKAGIEYFSKSLDLMRRWFNQVSLEVQPLQTDEYELLARQGLHGVFIYQETYNEKRYPHYHPSGPKSEFRFRLETPDRLGSAGVHKIGIGNLIGLENWRTEAWFTALHLQYLQRKYWKTSYSISFPRLRPFSNGGFQPNHEASERNLVQLICAYRLYNRHVDLSLSTRESPAFRDNVMPLGITVMSAGSKTSPLGYTGSGELEQFAVNDDRSPLEVAKTISCKGFEPVWKDWTQFNQIVAEKVV